TPSGSSRTSTTTSAPPRGSCPRCSRSATSGCAPPARRIRGQSSRRASRSSARASSLPPGRSIRTRRWTWLTNASPRIKSGGKRPAAPAALVATPGLRESLIGLQEMPPERYTDYQWEVLEAILRLLPYAAAHLKVVFGERGEADFTEVVQGAVRALGSPDAPT